MSYMTALANPGDRKRSPVPAPNNSSTLPYTPSKALRLVVDDRHGER
jgi:hypothetical protein